MPSIMLYCLYLSMNQIHNKILKSWHKCLHSDQNVLNSEKCLQLFESLSFKFFIHIGSLSQLFVLRPTTGCRSNSLFSFSSKWCMAQLYGENDPTGNHPGEMWFWCNIVILKFSVFFYRKLLIRMAIPRLQVKQELK